MLSKEDYDIVLATSTGALPAWMARKYPEVERVDYEGRRHKFGQRHNACPNSEVFRKYSVALAAKLAERYTSNPHVKCWHVSNEYGGTCYCENCEKAFRIWLRKKYGTLDAVNKAWNTEFWGHTFYDWEEIVAPNSLSEGLWDERSAFAGLSIDLCYEDQIHSYYEYFYDKNIPVDMIPVDADFNRYQIIVAPVLYMVKEGMKESLEKFVREGGILVTTYMSGIVDQSDNVYLGGYPGPLREMAGLWVEEIDALAPEQKNGVTMDGTHYSCNLVCERMHLEGAESLGAYEEDFYAGEPAAARNRFGKGRVYYIGTQLEKAGKAHILKMALEEAGVESLIPEETGLEVICRQQGEKKLYFVMNFKDEEQKLPAVFAGRKDLLKGTDLTEDTVLKKYDVCLIEK